MKNEIRKKHPSRGTSEEAMRLQKYMAECGVASRRKAEEMIAEGRVTVNGVKITEMGTQVEEGDEVRVDGQVIRPETEKRYVMYHKPAGEVTTVSDPEGRRCVLDHFRDYPVRLYPVGRLDYDSAGLLLLTNDGTLTERMLHPSHQVDKTYLARVTGSVTMDEVRQLRSGVMLDDHKTAPAKVRVIKLEAEAAVVLVTIHEGRNRQVRRMFEETGHQVTQLRRVRFGPLDLGDLPRGKWRELTAEEVRSFAAYY
ncbi:MAG: rRNA pseudouridine synthase [Clostridia bacterium]|nr:rRNA pseudouridine synthase [Clostridia bacterium]